MKLRKPDIIKLLLLLVLSVGLSGMSFAQQDCDDDDDDPCSVPGGCGGGSPDSISIMRLHAVDPNDIIGPIGYDTARWMSVNDIFGYTIRFENDPDFATGPAQVVRINTPVDPHLDLASARITQFGFGEFIFTPPPNSAIYFDRLDVIDSLGVYVDVTAGIDVTKGELFWIFESIDPLTGMAPEDGNVGFLPVNDTSVTIYTDTVTQQGEGFVSFTIFPKDNSETGDTAHQQAVIIFDQNEAIETNTWSNVIDALPPTTVMNPLPAISGGVLADLGWSSEDDPGGVGVASYDLYVSKDSAQYFLHTAGLTTNATEFIGKEGSTYAFYVRAKDHVGNEEPQKFMQDAFTEFGASVEIATRVFLQGPYNAMDTLMIDQLRQDGVIPLLNPFAAKGYPFATAAQAISDPGILDSTGPNAIVDWVYVELIDLSSDSAVAGTPALLQRDGDIVQRDGVSAVSFGETDQGMYQLAIHHRNHLAVLTSENVIVITNGMGTADLTENITSVVGGQNAVIQIGGKYVMIAGDVDQNGQVQNSDIYSTLPKVGMSGYFDEDIDMNGQVEDQDIQLNILPNLGRGKQFENE